MEVISLGSDLLPIPLYFAVFLVGDSDVELAILSYDPPFPDWRERTQEKRGTFQGETSDVVCVCVGGL